MDSRLHGLSASLPDVSSRPTAPSRVTPALPRGRSHARLRTVGGQVRQHYKDQRNRHAQSTGAGSSDTHAAEYGRATAPRIKPTTNQLSAMIKTGDLVI